MFANRPNPTYTEETIALSDNKYRDYTKPALRAESAYYFYDRSSLTGYTHLRQMLQRWVDRLPPDKQKDIVGRMPQQRKRLAEGRAELQRRVLRTGPA